MQRHIKPLWRAFEWYRLAKDESSPERRAWLIFGANLLITEVEQDLLDPAFGVVIDHIPSTWRRR